MNVWTRGIVCVLVVGLWCVQAGASGGVYIAPGNVGVRTGAGLTFKAFCRDSRGKDSRLVEGAAEWSVDPAAGSVDSSGLFLAGSTPGIYYLRAHTSRGTALAQIEVFAPKNDGGYEPVCWWGASAPEEFRSVNGVAVDSRGDVYVADTYSHRIQKFDSEGNFIMAWGCRGEMDGEFNQPFGVAADKAGNVYVTESRNHRVQRFDSSGRFICQFQRSPQREWMLIEPAGVSVDSYGSVYVASAWNGQIHKYSPDGKLILAWGCRAESDEQRPTPIGVAVDSSGNVFVADCSNCRIREFSPSGDLMSFWGGTWNLCSSEKGKFNGPLGLAIDSKGKLYVADYCNHRIQKFDLLGQYITSWDSGDGPLGYVRDVAVDSADNVYVVDGGNSRIQKFDSEGHFIGGWGRPGGSDFGEFVEPYCLAVSPSGHVYVTDNDNNRVQEFDGSGTFIRAWGSEGKGCGQFSNPRGIAVGPSGSVYVADTSNSRVQKFDAQGNFVGAWGAYGGGVGYFGSPDSLAVDSSENVYVADISRVQEFDSWGNGIAGWDSGRFRYPAEISIDFSDTLFVLYEDNGGIEEFSLPTGSSRWWRPYSPKTFSWASGMTTDVFAYTYVSDLHNKQVCKYDPSGRLVAEWGSTGSGKERLFQPFGLAVDGFGNVYVADVENSRIVKYAPPTDCAWAWGVPGESGAERADMWSDPLGLGLFVVSGNPFPETAGRGVDLRARPGGKVSGK